MRSLNPPPTSGTLNDHAASSVVEPFGGIALGSRIVATVVVSPSAPTGCPFTASRVTRMPSVSSIPVSASARTASGRKMFWSSRSTITRSAESLVLWMTTRSVPLTVDVAASSRASMS